MFRPAPPWFWLSVVVSAIGLAFLLWPALTRLAHLVVVTVPGSRSAASPQGAELAGSEAPHRSR